MLLSYHCQFSTTGLKKYAPKINLAKTRYIRNYYIMKPSIAIAWSMLERYDCNHRNNSVLRHEYKVISIIGCIAAYQMLPSNQDVWHELQKKHGWQGGSLSSQMEINLCRSKWAKNMLPFAIEVWEILKRSSTKCSNIFEKKRDQRDGSKFFSNCTFLNSAGKLLIEISR